MVWSSDRWSGARSGGLVLGLVVWCSDQWSGARSGGLVLRWWLRHGGGVVSVACVPCYDVRGTWRGLQHPRARGWSRRARECAVLVCLETEDGLGIRAYGMEHHGRSSKVRRRAGEELGAHHGCYGREDGGAVTICGRVAPEAMPCSVVRSGLIHGGAPNSGVLPVLLPAVASFSSLELLLSLLLSVRSGWPPSGGGAMGRALGHSGSGALIAELGHGARRSTAGD
jgi:hypothetical protein